MISREFQSSNLVHQETVKSGILLSVVSFFSQARTRVVDQFKRSWDFAGKAIEEEKKWIVRQKSVEIFHPEKNQIKGVLIDPGSPQVLTLFSGFNYLSIDDQENAILHQKNLGEAQYVLEVSEGRLSISPLTDESQLSTKITNEVLSLNEKKYLVKILPDSVRVDSYLRGGQPS